MPSALPAITEDKLDFKAIKAAIPLASFIMNFTNLRQNGSVWKGSCPLGTHSDTTPSFNVYADNHWHCYGCNQTGDIFDFAKTVLDISPRELWATYR
jgi:DNA primase